MNNITSVHTRIYINTPPVEPFYPHLCLFVDPGVVDKKTFNNYDAFMTNTEKFECNAECSKIETKYSCTIGGWKVRSDFEITVQPRVHMCPVLTTDTVEFYMEGYDKNKDILHILSHTLYIVQKETNTLHIMTSNNNEKISRIIKNHLPIGADIMQLFTSSISPALSIVYYDLTQQKLSDLTIITYINYLKQQILPYITEEKPKYKCNVLGACVTSTQEKEADVILDPQHYYEIKDPLISGKYFSLVRKYSTYLFNIYQLQSVQYDFPYLNFAHKLVGCERPHYQIAKDVFHARPYSIDFTHIDDFIQASIDKLNDIMQHDGFSPMHTFKEVYQTIENLVKYSIRIKIIKPTTKILPAYKLVLNYYRKQYKLDNFLYTNPYNKLSTRYVISNILRIHTLQNTKIIEIPCNCRQQKLACIIDCPRSMQQGAIIYNSCARTVFAAFKRQCKLVPRPDPAVLSRYYKFCDLLFDKILKPYLDQFDYSLNQWLAKEPYKKQNDIIRMKDHIIHVMHKNTLRVVHTLFCKIEKQEIKGKNRAISGIDTIVKYIMGPVCWRLEHIFSKTKIYCGDKNADDYSHIYTQQQNYNKICLEGDGSGFDQTQNIQCKYIDRKIYQYICSKNHIYHCNNELFLNVACSAIKTLNAPTYTRGHKVTMMSADLIGSVFSGSSDTTLMNTIRMATYNLFALYEAGIIDDNTITEYLGLHKGDDFVEFIPRNIDQKHLTDVYHRIWLKKTEVGNGDKVHGLGQIIKILEFKEPMLSCFCSGILLPGKGNVLYYARDPKRMCRFGFYSRKAVTMNPSFLKQYLIDLAVAIEAAGLKDVPIYNAFYTAYKYEASLIIAPPIRQPEGIAKYIIKPNMQEGSFIGLQLGIKQWCEDKNTDLILKYRTDRDYLYSRIKNDRTEIVDIDYNKFYDSLNQRYTTNEVSWTKTTIDAFQKFMIYPTKNIIYQTITNRDTMRQSLIEPINLNDLI
jgi:hypothetical protein